MSSEEAYQIVNITNKLIYNLSNESFEDVNNKSLIDENITKEPVKHGVVFEHQEDKCLNSLYIVFGLASSIILTLSIIIVLIKRFNCIKKDDYLK